MFTQQLAIEDDQLQIENLSLICNNLAKQLLLEHPKPNAANYFLDNRVHLIKKCSEVLKIDNDSKKELEEDLDIVFEIFEIILVCTEHNVTKSDCNFTANTKDIIDSFEVMKNESLNFLDKEDFTHFCKCCDEFLTFLK